MFHPDGPTLKERLLSCAWTRRWESPHSTLQSSSALHSMTNFDSTAPHLTGVPDNGLSLWWCFLQSSSITAWEANHTPPALLRLIWLKEKRGWKIAEEMKYRNICTHIYIFPDSLKKLSTWIRADAVGLNQENSLFGGASKIKTKKRNYLDLINWIICSF